MSETTILVTGGRGFIGKNLCLRLAREAGLKVLSFDLDDDPSLLEEHLGSADLVYHLAGVNRPQRPEEFSAGNTGLTATILGMLERSGRAIPVVMSSSTQAGLENPYGKSKRDAEELVFRYGARSGAPVYVYRLTNVFGKWSRPNYNSVVATFCHNISHGLGITISDPAATLELVYIDDLVEELAGIPQGRTQPSSRHLAVRPTYRVTLAELAAALRRFSEMRATLLVPDLSDDFTRKLHATYLSYLEGDDFNYPLEVMADHRGQLAELIKSASFGQLFVSRTNQGVTRGKHYHDSKIEKFCVLQGEAVVRLRHVLDDRVLAYRVSGAKWEVVDIPPGYTHEIENLSGGEMILLCWANSIFNPLQPDTYACEVRR